MHKYYQAYAIAILAVTLTSCVSNQRQYPMQKSYLEQTPQQVATPKVSLEQNSLNEQAKTGFNVLPSMVMRDTTKQNNKDLADYFSSNDNVEITANELPLDEFIHYVMGDILKVNYIIGESAKEANKSVTLNIQQKISKQKLFVMTRDLLLEKGFVIRNEEDIFYINSEEASAGKSAIVFGYGRSIDSVPNSTSDILQIVPFKYGLRSNLSLILPRLTAVKFTPDTEQNSAMLQGKRADIIKALDFIHLIDTPARRNQQVAAFKSTFVPVKELLIKLNELLKKEGYTDGLPAVTLETQSMLVLFSADKQLLSRAKFWLQQLDVPADNDDKQYFVFQPLYARATDLVESLAPLLGGGQASIQPSNRSTSSNSNSTSNNNKQQSSIKSAGNDDVSVVVDERSNSLIVNASGKKYRALLPLIERLDVLPKQVMLEVMIAEVTLKDEFAQGLEFFLTENNFTLGNLGAFGEAGIGGLSYMLTGSNKWDVNASLSQTNSLFNVISRPSLVVRDGVTANLQVGTDIPIVSSTSAPDIGTTTSVQYRKTGLTLSVTPTVNSRGVVIMEIDQQVSNVVVDGKAITAEGAPSIFTRNMKTELVANSGQTVILGGLISENNTNSESKVPGLGDIPIIGNLFTSISDVNDKTELVIMVTPRIIESANQWDDIKAAMRGQLEQIKITEQKH